MAVVLAIPTLTPAGAERTKALIQAARAGSRPPDVVLVIDNGGHFDGVPDVIRYRPPKNLGVAPSWNEALRVYGRHRVILANDDITLAYDSIAKLVEAEASCDADVGLVCTTGFNFCFFMHRASATARVGYYDEGFFPAYFEDTDYRRRLAGAGMKIHEVETGVVHDEQRTTRDLGYDKAWNAPYWKSNEQRYQQKWRGADWKRPFNVDFELVVPMRRGRMATQLLESVAWQTIRPSRVTLVTNADLSETDTFGLAVRQLSFSSEKYAIGEGDVSLRRNIGTWKAESPWILYSDDDHVWPQTAFEGFVRRFAAGDRMVVGHYRFIPEVRLGAPELRTDAPEKGRSREAGVNRQHGWQSCYGGSLGVETAHIRRLGGWDMALACSEDQQLAIRAGGGIGAKVFVREPPFAWHPEERQTLEPEPNANTCLARGEEHRMVDRGDSLEACESCPRVVSKKLDMKVRSPFDVAHVRIEERWL